MLYNRIYNNKITYQVLTLPVLMYHTHHHTILQMKWSSHFTYGYLYKALELIFEIEFYQHIEQKLNKPVNHLG